VVGEPSSSLMTCAGMSKAIRQSSRSNHQNEKGPAAVWNTAPGQLSLNFQAPFVRIDMATLSRRRTQAEPHTSQRPARRRRSYDRSAHRLREIERIIADRYGQVADTDDADLILSQVASCLFVMLWKRNHAKPTYDEILDRLRFWCERWAPDVSLTLISQSAKDANHRRRIDSADDCARALRLSYADRTRLCITTIGAYDVNRRQRKQLARDRKRARDREQAAKKRAERGALPRAQYCKASLSATRPWQDLGISRRTWERRRRKANPKGVQCAN
jgi:hypothetical protein